MFHPIMCYPRASAVVENMHVVAEFSRIHNQCSNIDKSTKMWPSSGLHLTPIVWACCFWTLIQSSKLEILQEAAVYWYLNQIL